MKIRVLWIFFLCFTVVESITAQQDKPLTLKEAIRLALENSDEAKIAEEKVHTAKSELNVTKNTQYPDLKVSGQYQYLTSPNIQSSLLGGTGTDKEGGAGDPPDINQLLLGQVNASIPVFSGFKLKNLVNAGENRLEAARLTAVSDKEQLTLHTVKDYIDLYKARQTVKLVRENLKSARQRVKDFSAMEENGLLARNDLLKAKLQESNVRVTLEEAMKNERILNYRLATLLKLPSGTEIGTVEEGMDMIPVPESDTVAVSRSDLEALRYREKAAENQVKVAQSKFFPAISLLGGYVALDAHNVLTVTNAMNFGVGLSYNLADIFKSKSDIKLARSRATELQYTLNQYSDQVDIQVKNALEDYRLALKKFEVYTESREQAIENYRIVKDKYDNGLVDTNDLLEADVDQLQARINLAYSRADITRKYYEFLTAQGTLTNYINK
ncbi:TolC family protein [Sinomicrobium weinanense]|uniref:TolC family protein n=1 Tax=Sinomicrobium weinanense TaxID=2842200 RepID=A0A926JP91_9FLAO|nr:TolC family protein [Sinomicrobium weinanense]MBC9794772.1 TolC family protein [Sinomicrobium weinanense]MBU3125031.1 TolC family protein [Sinomicrobium weinanense]